MSISLDVLPALNGLVRRSELPAERRIQSLAGVVVGSILSIQQHPFAHELRIATVDAGDARPLQIIVGGPRVEQVGSRVAVARAGVATDAGRLRRRRYRREISEAMICSALELDLGSDMVMILPADAVVGTPLHEFVEGPADLVGRARPVPHAATLGAGSDGRAVRATVAGMTELNRPQAPPAPARPRHAEDFDAFYQETPPWEIGRPQPAFLELAQAGMLRGRVLDVGCGTGEHALMAAGLGLEATGVDAARAAITIAEGKARDRGLPAVFMVADALDLASLNRQFDTVLDSGLFHVFEDDDRRRYVDGLRAVLPAGGRYHMLCFSDRQSGDWGPRRVTQEEIRASFDAGWHVDSIEAARFAINMEALARIMPDAGVDPDGPAAWRVAVTRT